MHLTTEHWTTANDIYDRITTHYGVPAWHDGDVPELVCFYDPEDCYGYWDEGRIWINFGCCETWEDVVGTMIHEWVHAWQELEADAVAKRDLHLFMDERRKAA